MRSQSGKSNGQPSTYRRAGGLPSRSKKMPAGLMLSTRMAAGLRLIGSGAWPNRLNRPSTPPCRRPPMKAIDLFAGAGGFSTGAAMAGCEGVWAANHWPEAVRWHAANHPDAEHVCQDLHQARWEDVPAHDLMLASPCCQGHSKARGKAHGNPQHDASRSTAWAVVSAAEYHRPELI